MKRVAGIILKDCKGRILTIHASKHPITRWGVPKGRIDKDETPKQAAIREFCEETGINLKAFKKDIKKICKLNLKNKELHLFELVIYNQISAVVDGVEIDGCEWIKRKDFKYFGEKTQGKVI